MKKHIILIDDDRDELVIFMDALRKVPSDDGFKCTYANSSAQAIEMLKYLVPDYVFADFNMPGMNGLELLHYIKTLERFRTSQLFLYSTFVSQETKDKTAGSGITWIQKANTIDALVKDLSRLFLMRQPANYFISNISLCR